MEIRAISAEDGEGLLAFELENKSWFEEHIEARAEGFYSSDGVQEHIHQLLSACQSGAAYPGLILEQGEILGRVNLIRIPDTTKFRLGYRVAKKATGRGIASSAVAFVLDKARTDFSCSAIVALVSTVNHASQRVLARNGFKPLRLHRQHAFVAGQWLDCVEYELRLSEGSQQ